MAAIKLKEKPRDKLKVGSVLEAVNGLLCSVHHTNI